MPTLRSSRAVLRFLDARRDYDRLARVRNVDREMLKTAKQDLVDAREEVAKAAAEESHEAGIQVLALVVINQERR